MDCIRDAEGKSTSSAGSVRASLSDPASRKTLDLRAVDRGPSAPPGWWEEKQKCPFHPQRQRQGGTTGPVALADPEVRAGHIPHLRAEEETQRWPQGSRDKGTLEE